MMTKKEILPATGGFLCVDFSADCMGEHRVRDLFKAGDIGTCNIIAGHAVSFCGTRNVLIDAAHDGVQIGIDFLKAPTQTLAVLGQSASS